MDGEKESCATTCQRRRRTGSVGARNRRRGASTGLGTIRLSIIRKVKKQGLDVPADMPNLETLRSWTLTFQTRAANVRMQVEGLRKGLSVVERLPRRLADLEAMQSQIEKTKVAVSEASTRRTRQPKGASAFLNGVSLLERNVGDLEERLSLLRWLQESLPKHSAFSGRNEASRVA